jgi:type IV secretion system pilin
MNSMTWKWAKRLVITTSSFGLLMATVVFAQLNGSNSGGFGGGGAGSGPVTLPNPLGANSTFQTVVTSVTNFLIIIAIPLTTIMALIGAFQMLTSAGDPEKFSKGQKTLIYAAIGFFIVLVSGSIVALIKNIFGGSS